MVNLPLTEIARAKVNLTLHVGPPEKDGYHPLQSLVVFADVGDLVRMQPAVNGTSTLSIDGPFSVGLETDDSNLILKTARFLGDEQFDFRLTKNLPVSSGIGGGSADAAATVRLIRRHRQSKIDQHDPTLVELGADVPVCLRSFSCLMEGKGERVTLLLTDWVHAVLVNPGIAVSTREVFNAFDKSEPDRMNLSKNLPRRQSLLEMARSGRNDLQEIAISLVPEIANCLSSLQARESCQLARMSGSGATCFGIFPDSNTAHMAQQEISERHPDWWCVQTVIGNQP